MQAQTRAVDTLIAISGRRLSLPAGPIFRLQSADQADYEIGEFRAWAGYKNFGSDAATNDLAHFQHVLSFTESSVGGRTGVHAHLAHAHVIIPTSGRGVFSYDGVVTEATPGAVIVQHGGTVHDQFEYSHAATSPADNALTPQTIEPVAPDATPRSFGFLELFVPKIFANVEIVAPSAVSEAHQSTAWDHPYHAAGERFHIQPADAPEAAYRPVAMRPDLEVRDAQTWAATGGLVATWFIRPATSDTLPNGSVSLEIVGESGGVDIFYMVGGSARFLTATGETIILRTGDTLTVDQAVVGEPFECSHDMRLIRFFIAARAQSLRERTAEEIERLEALGPAIITRSEVRPADDTRPINFFQDR